MMLSSSMSCILFSSFLRRHHGNIIKTAHTTAHCHSLTDQFFFTMLFFVNYLDTKMMQSQIPEMVPAFFMYLIIL